LKKILILSENKIFKKELTTLLVTKIGKDNFEYTTVSDRSNAIMEISQKEYQGVVIDCTLTHNDLQMILKYLSTNEYYFSNIFFLSDNFSVFQEILENLNFPHLNLISLPRETASIADEIFHKVFPIDTKSIDKHYKINLEFLKVFVDSTKRVLNEFCNLEKVSHGRPYLRTIEHSIKYDLMGDIVLKSEIFEGRLKLGFQSEIYLDLINKVLMIDATEVSDDNVDFIAELVNMIYGQSKIILNETGHNFLKVIPRFELNPEDNFKYHTIVVPLNTTIGLINLEIEVVHIEGFDLSK
jgi:CheY-specific phosphatase CheX